MKNKKKLVRLAIAGAAVATTLGVGSSPASAAHCTDYGMPGNSDFSVHVRANNGPGGHNEGEHKGWSSCL